MSTKHTPGPWMAKPNKWNEAELIVQAGPPTNRVLASFGSESEPLDDINRADARLIAEAPTLLRALKKLANSVPADAEMAEAGWSDVTIKEVRDAYDEARAAIARATGEAAS